VGTITRDTGENYLFHTLKQQNVMEIVQTSSKGLSFKEAEMRLLKYGKNKLQEGKKKSIFIMFLEQFKNIMVVILLIAAVISGLLGELTDTFIILAVVFINAFVGIIQENKAEKALAALEKMSAPFARVKRNGIVQSIKSEDIVPGDIVLIEAGDYIPADMRLIESASLKIEEASLTGESVPVEKTVNVIEKKETVIGDRQNMAYSGSSVTYGRGAGIVTATGMDTETGRIAEYLAEQDFEQTPLQKKLVIMGKYMSIAVVFIAIVIFLTGILQGRNYFEMFLTAVSLAVAAIPEGLPAIVTIVLAIGVQKMSSRNAIIRKLPAVETLGSTEIICSDKTGTLTQNKMAVKQLSKSTISQSAVYLNSFAWAMTGANVYLQAIQLFGSGERNVRTIQKSQLASVPFGTAVGIMAVSAGIPGPGWIAGGVTAAVMGFWTAFTHQDYSREVFVYDVQGWQPPVGGEHCYECNDLKYGCSEYQCNTFGTACELINEGSDDERCVWANEDDIKPPEISSLDNLDEGFSYSPSNKVDSPNRGVDLLYEGGCIDPFTSVKFAVKTDEPAQCKLDVKRNPFENMSSSMNEGSRFTENHTMEIPASAIPSASALEEIGWSVDAGKDYSFYISCRDYNGNVAPYHFVVNFCVDDGPDTSPPIITKRFFINFSFIH